MKFWFVIVVPKYLSYAILLKHLLAIFMSRFFIELTLVASTELGTNKSNNFWDETYKYDGMLWAVYKEHKNFCVNVT
jgi:hypothetical protein